jgi:dCTP deaminase
MLSDQALRARLKGRADDGSPLEPLVIAPLVDTHGDDDGAVQGCSVDLRLGTWFEVPRLHARVAHALYAAGGGAELQERPGKSVFIPLGKEFFLHPGNFVLAVSLEWVGMPADLAGVVTGKSKWGRRGLNVATATVVHPYFLGCITLELANIGEYPITLRPGTPIFQMQVHHLSSRADLPIKPSKLVGHRRPTSVDVLLEDRAAALASELN